MVDAGDDKVTIAECLVEPHLNPLRADSLFQTVSMGVGSEPEVERPCDQLA